MSKLNKLGIKGEEIAEKFLINKGHSILYKNLKISYKEVDLITLDRDSLVFIEVKTRKTLLGGYPEDHISNAKIKNLKEAALIFLHQNPQYEFVRFDVISIVINNSNAEITHFEDAFF